MNNKPNKYEYNVICCIGCNKKYNMYKPLWDKQIIKFGSVENVRTQYKCKKCRKQ